MGRVSPFLESKRPRFLADGFTGSRTSIWRRASESTASAMKRYGIDVLDLAARASGAPGFAHRNIDIGAPWIPAPYSVAVPR